MISPTCVGHLATIQREIKDFPTPFDHLATILREIKDFSYMFRSLSDHPRGD